MKTHLENFLEITILYLSNKDPGGINKSVFLETLGENRKEYLNECKTLLKTAKRSIALEDTVTYLDVLVKAAEDLKQKAKEEKSHLIKKI